MNKDFLAFAAAKYYAGEPVITDAEFDRLVEIHGFDGVGAAVDLSKAVPHAYRMYSLTKCFVGEPLIDLPGATVKTKKLDGAAISMLFIGGDLVRGLTRGDGKQGHDITSKALHLVRGVRNRGSFSGQVTGEVVARKSVPNSRNYAAGALNLKELREFQTRELYFVAYGLQPSKHETWSEDMAYLRSLGFNTVLDSDISLDEFPQDGEVFRVDNNEQFQELGYTDKHPRGAFALKEVQEGVITTLEKVEWQVGRSGVVAPVALLTPVKVGDATVSRATLHNFKYIEGLGLEEGCQVEIIRSGEIIPRVVRRVDV